MKRVLPVIILAQFFCTSVWFAVNAVADSIAKTQGFDISIVAQLTTAVQFGFISGTFLFAILSLADRWSPSKVFFVCSIAAGLCNLGVILFSGNIMLLTGCRFITGFFLAGIYPVGMKISADHARDGLGRWLGFLVGALVLGTALPHLLRSAGLALPWKYVIYTTSILAFAGGLILLLFVPDGPYRKKANSFNPAAIVACFRVPEFRGAALGYFGHMWELYSFWAFVPVILSNYKNNLHLNYNVALLSFMVIGIGAFSCGISGILSATTSERKLAAIALACSGASCFLSPLFLKAPPVLFFPFLLFWAVVVIADSPLFSAMVARYAPVASRGSALTIVNCIGFAITILSIQVLKYYSSRISENFIYVILGIGPVLGLLAMKINSKNRQ